MADARTNFGRFRGHRISAISTGYLEWTLVHSVTLTPPLRADIEAELARRRELAIDPHESMVPRRELERAIEEWHGDLRQRWQGDARAGLVVNDAVARLRQAMGLEE
jgi:hypothetical protein